MTPIPAANFESGIVVVSSWSEGLFVVRFRDRPIS